MKTKQANVAIHIRLAIILAASFVLPAATAEGQGRGFRIGNVIQAGGGQGFRIGGPRGGMHFGGGQGTTIGTQRFGMRFGNGQGARFGGVNYGMQFGGGQGTQFGRFSTAPTVQPGTYYYQNGTYYPMSGSPQVIGQPNVIGGIPQPAIQSSTAIINSNPLPSEGPGTGSDPTPIPPTNQPNTMDSNGNSVLETKTGGPQPLSSVPQSGSQANRVSSTLAINLSYPQSATQDMEYRMNGMTFTMKPGQSIRMSGPEIKIEFSAGPGLANRQAILTTSGNYFFQQQPAEGWMLMRDNATSSPPAEKSTIEKDESTPKIAPAILGSPPVEGPENQETTQPGTETSDGSNG